MAAVRRFLVWKEEQKAEKLNQVIDESPSANSFVDDDFGGPSSVPSLPIPMQRSPMAQHLDGFGSVENSCSPQKPHKLDLFQQVKDSGEYYYCHTKFTRYFEAKNGDNTLLRSRGKCITNGNANGLKSLDTSSNDSISQRARSIDQAMYESDENNKGPMTRRAWADYCSKRGKSPEDEAVTNHNNSSGNQRTCTSGKRNGKKTVTHRNLSKAKAKLNKKVIKDLEETKVNKKDEIYLPPPPARGGWCRRKTNGRFKKNKSKKISIVGLDVMHNLVLQCTSTQEGEKLPPAPGCVDHKLTPLTGVTSTGVFKHGKLTIPSTETPYARQKLLDLYRVQMLRKVDEMKTPEYKQQLLHLIHMEKQRKEYLMSRRDQLGWHTDKLIKDSTVLLREKSEELNILGEGATADTLLSEAREIVVRHKSIQAQLTALQEEVADLDTKVKRSRSTKWAEIPEVDLIVEKNPKVLAQKILEVRKKIEQNAPTLSFF